MTVIVQRSGTDGVPLTSRSLRRRLWYFDLTVQWGSARLYLDKYREEGRESARNSWCTVDAFDRIAKTRQATPPLPPDVEAEARSKFAEQLAQVPVIR